MNIDVITDIALKEILLRYQVHQNENAAVEEICAVLLIPDKPGRCNDPRNCGWTEEELDKLGVNR